MFSNSGLLFNHALNILQIVAQAVRHNITETRASRKRIWKRHELDSGEVSQIAILILVRTPNEIPATLERQLGEEGSPRLDCTVHVPASELEPAPLV